MAAFCVHCWYAQFHKGHKPVDVFKSSILAVFPPACSLVSMMGLNACIQQSHLMRTDSGDKPFCTDEFFVNALYL
jgi:hypothetical protein